jgi:hypothetical protein
MKHLLYLVIAFSLFTIKPAKAQFGSGWDSTFLLFPNPTHERFFLTTQGRVIYAFVVTTGGERKSEYLRDEIISYENPGGMGCSAVGCAGANISSNYICALYRKNLENGLYYIFMMDEFGRVYYAKFALI